MWERPTQIIMMPLMKLTEGITKTVVFKAKIRCKYQYLKDCFHSHPAIEFFFSWTTSINFLPPSLSARLVKTDV